MPLWFFIIIIQKEAEERENMADAMNYEEEGFDNRQERKTKISKLDASLSFIAITNNK